MTKNMMYNTLPIDNQKSMWELKNKSSQIKL